MPTHTTQPTHPPPTHPKQKTYPFSVAKHAHDVEFYHNRLYNLMHDMEAGVIPMNADEYDRMYDMYHGPLAELYDMMFQSRDGRIVYLTGPQIALAKQIVFWAAETRAATQLRKEKTP